MKVSVKGLGEVGMITDVDAAVLPDNAWTSLLNYRCVHGRVEPVDGYADFTSWSNVGSKEVYALTLEKIETETNIYWVYPYDDDGDGQAEAIYAYNGSSDSDISRVAGYAGGATDLWNSCHYNSLIVLNNGSDCPQYWDGAAATCADLKWDATHTWDDTAGGGETYSAKVIRSFKNFLFAFHINEDGTDYPQMVHWSAIADPGNVPIWTYDDPTNKSGRVQITETGGRVLDGLPLGEQMVVYKEDAIAMCSFVDGQYVFQTRIRSTSYGLWAPNCAVDIGGLHVVLGDGVVYTFDGHAPRNILEGKLADQLFDQIDVDNYQKCFLAHNKEETEVWICFPESGETWPKKSLIYNYGNGTWYYRTIPASSQIKLGIVSVTDDSDAWDDGTVETTAAWDAEIVEPWDSRSYSPIGDTLVAASDQLKEFGKGITSDAREGVRTNIIIEDPTSWYMTRTMYPVGTGEPFTIAVGGQEFVDGPVYWESEQTFTPGATRKLDWRTSYPIKALKINHTAVGMSTFDGYVIDHVKQGQR